MYLKKTVLIVDDDPMWLNDLSGFLKYFDVCIEGYSSFTAATDRITKSKASFSLLVTDIYPNDNSKEMLGFELAEFTSSILRIPVIIVTGYNRLIRTAFRYYNVFDAFDKGTFNELSFINSAAKILSSSVTSTPLLSPLSSDLSALIEYCHADIAAQVKTMMEKIDALPSIESISNVIRDFLQEKFTDLFKILSDLGESNSESGIIEKRKNI
jgi:CheY-like chemotaxis protein